MNSPSRSDKSSMISVSRSTKLIPGVISLLVVIVILLIIWFVMSGISDNRNRNTNETDSSIKIITKMPTLNGNIKSIPPPDINVTTQAGNQVIISDFQSFLTEWNKKMNWSFSTRQIEDYNRTLMNGLLKKYQKTPGYLTLDIPDMKSFCLEVGSAISLTKNQSETFATAADEDLRRAKIEFDKPILIDGLSIDKCSFNIERGTQKQFNISYWSYEYIADNGTGTLHFTSTQTPLNLVFSPSEFTMKSGKDYPASITITANLSIASGLYQFEILIDGKHTGEVYCKEGGPVSGYGQRMINVTVS